MDEAPVLELRGITKQFPGILANDHIDFDLRDGEVHALLGENGAGKSTLMNIVYGLYSADEGEIVIKGEPVKLSSPHDAIDRGIGMVHQHFMLIPVMTVTENIVLASEPRTGGVLLDYGAARDRGREVLLRVDKTAPHPGEALLEVDDLRVLDDRELEAVRDVSFEVHAGEIVGIAGVDGNGQTELIDALAGLRKPAGGRILIGGKELTSANANVRLEEGLGHIPEDR